MSEVDNPEQGRIPGICRLLGKRWTLPILKSMGSKEAMCFCEIKKTLAGISSTMLSERLSELEQEGLVAKKIYGSKVEYSLTANAKDLQLCWSSLIEGGLCITWYASL